MNDPENITVEQARSAKKNLLAQLTDVEEVNGIGITLRDGSYGLKVNLIKPTKQDTIPTEIDGVKISTDVVGQAYAA